MLLRRVIEHVKTQNWTAIAIDFLIVVAGVFVGLQVQEWNAARGHRAAEIGYLNSMEEDVEYSIVSLEKLLVDMQRQQAAHAALYRYSTDPAANIAQEELEKLIGVGLFYLPELTIRQVTFEALKSSGQLGAIRSPALASRLQSLSSAIDTAQGLVSDESEVTYLFSDPLLIANFDMAGVFKQPRADGTKQPIPWLQGERPVSPAPAVLKSLPFRNVLLYRSFFTGARMASIDRVLDQHRQIAGLIDARQAELGLLAE